MRNPINQHRGQLSPLCVLTCCSLALFASSALAAPRAVTVRLDPAVAAAPLTGRLFLFTSTQSVGEPRFGPNWFQPQPFYGIDVRDFAPGETRAIDDAADSFPSKLSQLPAGTYRVQTLLDHDFYDQSPARGEGNLYSDVVEWTIGPAGEAPPLEFSLTHVVKPRPFPASRFAVEIIRRSECLSAFHRREVLDRAAVLLPRSYFDEPTRRYGVIYSVTGFSGTHYPATKYEPPTPGEGETEFIRVVLSGNCKWGHHVYADSATNGPRGQALVAELVPHVDREFRTVAAPSARFLTGHSSGGWSSLWLQVTYPETFGGVWSTAPETVDFRDYQQVNLYADPPQSLYRDEQGGRRPIARRGTEPVLWYEDFGRMDDVLGRGGQLRSFEAVFSPLGADGLPRKLWDRETGRVDPEVARAWEKYDLRLVLERDWDRLRPLLAGKLHIFAAEFDTFFLEGAVRQLAASLKALGSDAVIEIAPGKNHSDVLSPELVSRIRREMTAALLTAHRESVIEK